MTQIEQKNIAFIDLGTNSARLLVVRINPNGSYNILTQQKEQIRLGEGGFLNNILTQEAIERTKKVVSGFIDLAKGFDSKEIIAVATSATRDAINGDELVRSIYEETGVYISVISGSEEARLIWLGISSGVEIGETKTLFIDIGGGSTEVIVADQYEPFLLRSLKLGAIRTTNAFFDPFFEDPVSPDLVREIRQHISMKSAHTLRHIHELEPACAYGSSGTIQALEMITGQMKDTVSSHVPGIIKIDELNRAIDYLCALPLKERRNLAGMNPDRADIIIAGALILQTILTGANIPAISISSLSLRDGLLTDYLQKIPGFPHAKQVPVKIRTITQLGRNFHIDEEHATHVTHLSLRLFDSGKEAGLHSLSGEAREILSYAAHLHDIGQFISFSGHHQHSYYVITNVPLLGFTSYETLLIALICRYHRKKIPKTRDSGYNELNCNDQVTVKILSQFLRIAENLSRSHDSRVKDARFTRMEEENIYLKISSKEDCSLEEWAVIKDRASFRKIFNRNLVLDNETV